MSIASKQKAPEPGLRARAHPAIRPVLLPSRDSKAPPKRHELIAVLTQALVAVLPLATIAALLCIAVWSWNPANQLKRDLHSDIILGLAARSNIDPYAPIDGLAKQTGFGDYKGVLRHPSPHTPSIAALFMVLSVIPQTPLHLAWIFFTALLAVIASFRLVRELNTGAPARDIARRTVLLSSFLLLSQAGLSEVTMGQYTFLILAVSTEVWIRSRRREDVAAGLWLGIILALKLFGIPLLLYFLYLRRWKSVLAALALSGSILMLSLGFLPRGSTVTYVKEALPRVSTYWACTTGNTSLAGLPLRLVWPLKMVRYGKHHPTMMPCQPGQGAAFGAWSAAGIALSFAVLAAVLYRAKRDADPDTAFCRCLALSAIFGSIAWHHYFLVLAVPFCLCLYNGKKDSGRKSGVAGGCMAGLRNTSPQVSIAILLALLISVDAYPAVMGMVPDSMPAAVPVVVPFILRLVTSLPTLAILLVALAMPPLAPQASTKLD